MASTPIYNLFLVDRGLVVAPVLHRLRRRWARQCQQSLILPTRPFQAQLLLRGRHGQAADRPLPQDLAEARVVVAPVRNILSSLVKVAKSF